MPSPEDKHDALNRLAHAFVQQLRCGQEVSIEAWARRHPLLAEDIRQLFPAMLALERIGQTQHGSATSRRDRETEEDHPLPERVGEFRILRRIGEGGMGKVYLAVQESLDRTVALKVLSLARPGGDGLAQFAREARVLARLHHTNIVPVFACGEDHGVHYYAMQYIAGPSLDQVIQDLNAIAGRSRSTATTGADPPDEPAGVSPPDSLAVSGTEVRSEAVRRLLGGDAGEFFRNIARLGVQAADALALAHACGVLHRDIKPANLLLDAQAAVWIADFGLAELEGEVENPAAEFVVGTPKYLPPERLRGQVADRRGDIYGLGLSIYALLVSGPFASGRTILERPGSNRSADGRIPRDLEAVVLKAVASDPHRRYQTAPELAADLRRFLEERPVSARRQPLLERAATWTRKNRLLAAVSVLAICLLTTTSAVSLLAYLRESAWRASLQQAAGQARRAELSARRQAYVSFVAAAQAARVSRRRGQRDQCLAAVKQALATLESLELPAADRAERMQQLRDLAASGLALPEVFRSGVLPAGAVLDVFHPTRYLQRSPLDDIAIHDFQGAQLASLRVSPRVSPHFTPQEETLLLLDEAAGQVSRWSLGESAAQAVLRLPGADGVVEAAHFGWKSRRVLFQRLVGGACRLDVVDWNAGRLLWHWEASEPDAVQASCLSPDGRWAAVAEQVGDEQCLVRLFDIEAGSPMGTLPTEAHVHSASFHPDSQTLALGKSPSNHIELWNVARRELVAVLTEQRGGGPEVAFDASGELLVSFSTWTLETTFWRPYSRQVALHLGNEQFDFRDLVSQGFQGGAEPAGLSAVRSDGSASHRGVWTAQPSLVVRSLARNPAHGEATAWRDVSIHPDGRLLAVGSDNGVCLFDLHGGQDLGMLPVGHALWPCFIPATGDLLTFSDQGLLLWPVGRASSSDERPPPIGTPRRLPCPAGFGTQVACDRSGAVIAVARLERALVLHDFGRRVVELPGLTDCRYVAVSPDGRLAATASHGKGSLQVWDADSGQLVHDFGEVDGERGVRFSPDGRLLSFGWRHPGLVRTSDWQAEPMAGWPSPQGACFSPRGDLLLAPTSNSMTLRDARDGSKLCELVEPDGGTLWFGAFTPDGGHAVMSSNDTQTVYVWDLKKLYSHLDAMGLAWRRPEAAGATGRR